MRQRGGLGTRLSQYINHVYSVNETYRTVLSNWYSHIETKMSKNYSSSFHETEKCMHIAHCHNYSTLSNQTKSNPIESIRCLKANLTQNLVFFTGQTGKNLDRQAPYLLEAPYWSFQSVREHDNHRYKHTQSFSKYFPDSKSSQPCINTYFRTNTQTIQSCIKKKKKDPS